MPILLKSSITGNGLIQFLVIVLIIIIVAYALRLLFDAIAAPQPIRMLCYLILAVAAIIYLANRFLGIGF